MTEIKNYKRYLKIINKIQKTRTKNNKNWMDLLRLSLKLDFNSTSKIIKEIFDEKNLIFSPKMSLIKGSVCSASW